MAAITSEADLRALHPPPKERTLRKQLDRLDHHCRRFIELAPFVVMATADAEGRLDATPRGGEPGNLTEHPEIGLLFVIPGVDESLRVNGAVELRTDAELVEPFRVGRSAPTVVLRITVREAYLHCGKAMMRSRLWSPEAQTDRSELPTLGAMLREQTRVGRAESQTEMLARYRNELY
jgi:predicted pyridoxine 5'-phosphate oxidase superfamily flavin-nucleotide-binding protein